MDAGPAYSDSSNICRSLSVTTIVSISMSFYYIIFIVQKETTYKTQINCNPCQLQSRQKHKVQMNKIKVNGKNHGKKERLNNFIGIPGKLMSSIENGI